MPINYKRRGRHRRHLSEPSEPPVYFGEFQGRKLSELSDEELIRFTRRDAMLQFKPAPAPFIASIPPSCHDKSQYWFAKYELERRKPESAREASASLNISPSDMDAAVALKLALHGYHAASQKYHPDHGGSTQIMQKINAAVEFARRRLKHNSPT